jgi:hypothetical protein
MMLLGRPWFDNSMTPSLSRLLSSRSNSKELTGRQAEILSILESLRQSHGTLTSAKQAPAWKATITRATRLDNTMPLWKLQRLRHEALDFLYAKSPVAGNIRLKRGVAANLRRFHSMIIRLAQSEWMHYIQALPHNSQCWDPPLHQR